MTYMEKLLSDLERVKLVIRKDYCPNSFGLEKMKKCPNTMPCDECWNREMEENND